MSLLIQKKIYCFINHLLSYSTLNAKDGSILNQNIFLQTVSEEEGVGSRGEGHTTSRTSEEIEIKRLGSLSCKEQVQK